jgi:hypothetical protein
MSNFSNSVKDVDLSRVFSENVAAKVFQVAHRGLKQEVIVVAAGSHHFILMRHRLRCQLIRTLYLSLVPMRDDTKNAKQTFGRVDSSRDVYIPSLSAQCDIRKP